MRKLYVALLGLFFTLPTYAQVVTTIPFFPLQTGEVTIRFNAAEGNGALKGFTGDVFAHAGVITSESSTPTDWRYVVGNWGEFDARVLMQRVDTDIYELTYDIRDFYGVPAEEKILRLAFVFRDQNGTGELVGRAADGSDIFTPVYAQEDGLLTAFITPNESNTVYSPTDTIRIQTAASQASQLSLFNQEELVASAENATELAYNLPVEAPGIFNLTIIATTDTESDSSTFSYIVVDNTQGKADPPVATVDGINYLSDTSVLLRLYAPGKESIFVIGDFNDWEVLPEYLMQQSVDGNTFWLQIEGLTPGETYGFQYLVDGLLKIADPYTELVLDEGNDPFIPASTFPDIPPYPSGKTSGNVSVLQPGRPEFDWQYDDTFTPPEKGDLVIYELLLRDFLAAHDYNTLIDTLDYLDRLGVNAIEFMPISEFEGNLSWGYNPSFHLALDKYYGNPESFKRFVDEAHRRGIAVILDVVYNHAFSQSPLAQLYWDATNFRPSEDNPWLNVEARHPFNVGYDFDHESEATRRFVDRALEYWIETYHVDGYRFDLSKGFTQRNSGNDVGFWSSYDASRIEILKHYSDVVWGVNPDAYVIMEHFGGGQEEREMSDYGMMLWGNMNFQYNEASMGYESDLTGTYFGDRGWTQPNLISFMESHDEERLMYKNLSFGNSSGDYNVQDLTTALQRQELVSAFYYTIPGPKMLWQFGELGYDFPINYCPNGTINESCRVDNKPIRWDYWEDPQRIRLYEITRELISLKKQYAVFSTTDVSFRLNSRDKRIQLSHPEMDVTVLGNFNVVASTINPSFQQTGWWYEYFSGDSLFVENVNFSLPMEPGEYRLYSTQKLARLTGTTTNRDDELRQKYAVKVWPNPSQGQLNLSWSQSQASTFSINVSTPTGSRVAEITPRSYQPGSHHLTIELPLAQGVYLMEMNWGNEASIWEKVVIFY